MVDKVEAGSASGTPTKLPMGSKPGFAKGSSKIKLNRNFKRWRQPGKAEEATKETASPQEPESATRESDLEARRRALRSAKQQTEAEDSRRREEQVGRERDGSQEGRGRQDRRASTETPPPETPGPPPPGKKLETPPAAGRKAAAQAAAAEEAETSVGGRRAKKGGRSETRRPGGRREGGRRQNQQTWLTQEEQDEKQKSLAAKRRREQREKRRQKESGEQVERVKIFRDVQIPDAIIVQDLANRMAEPSSEVIKRLIAMGKPTTINETLDGETAEILVQEFGHRPVRVSASDVELGLEGPVDAPESLRPRAPVVTVMGHVDHGKTSLLDQIRSANVAAGEAGAITQHIGAYRVEGRDGPITFLDTPGHAAFSAMRARGAKVTDLVVLVVAANDGLMPQTEEAINHAMAAGVPIVVAINKIDLADANPAKVRDSLLRLNVAVESRGGEVLDAELSAKTGEGIPALLEAISLQAGLLELKANPDRAAEGSVIEARLDRSRGAVATVLIERGTLRKGDVFVIGVHSGRVRTMRDERGEVIESAGPSVPVELDGLGGTPEAGDRLVVVESEARAREIARYRADIARGRQVAPAVFTGVETMLGAVKEEQPSQLPLVVKADVRGSVEAVLQSIAGIGNEDVKTVVLSSGVGQISISDVTLAAASKGIVVGFNVKPDAQAAAGAREYQVDILQYSVIYQLIDDVKNRAGGLLAPDIREHGLGKAEVLQVFRVKGVGAVAGCRVFDGTVKRGARVRLRREDEVVYDGTIETLKHVKDDVASVQAGMECGMSFRDFRDCLPGDSVEIFETEEVVRSL